MKTISNFMALKTKLKNENRSEDYIIAFFENIHNGYCQQIEKFCSQDNPEYSSKKNYELKYERFLCFCVLQSLKSRKQNHYSDSDQVTFVA